MADQDPDIHDPEGAGLRPAQEARRDSLREERRSGGFGALAAILLGAALVLLGLGLWLISG